MEEGQELKHVCKFCNKSFPCGRSLGGHMRYHVINSTETGPEHLKTKKLSSVNNGGSKVNPDTAYVLRENPKKTCRFADSSEDTLLRGKLCKDCGKVFQSWKTLFSHMKFHSEGTVDEESWTRTSANQKLVMDSQSDNEAVAPNRRKRSSRRVKRYMSTATSSSFSVAKSSSSASEIEQEQEEVAMCLMMLSRDVSRLGGSNSVPESSDNNSDFSEPPSLSPTNQLALPEGKSFLRDGGRVVKLEKLINGKLEYTVLDSENSKFDGKQTEFGVSDFSRTESKMNKSGVSVNGYLGDAIFNKLKVDESEFELGKNVIDEIGLDRDQLGGSKKQSSSKRKCRNLFDPELDGEAPKKLTCGALDSEMHRWPEKRGKFECATCNRTFHSYQALGGHRASHKKIKACVASKIDSSENNIETGVSPDPTADGKLIKSLNNYSIYREMVAGRAEKAETSHGSKKGTEHECPICFKVFPSGQALGGHKRSHLVSGSLARSNQAIVTEKPIHEIRDLDLNLPAPGEEESNGHVGFKPWWVGINHKHDPLMSLSAL